MLESVLIANRGEIACRIIQTARALGIRTIAVYSDADAKARHVAMADEAYRLGPAPAAQSYLDADKLLAVAKEAGAQAIHPGYGFLSENAAFARACAEKGIVFVGPKAEAIEVMGQKDRAKALMERAGVPVVPGYHGDNQDPDFLHEQARHIGYPVLIKAVSGGGGKGMRLVEEDGAFLSALASAQREGQNAFGDPTVLIERFVQNPRHIEIQVFADQHGNAVHLFERDCSLQRRHQKVVEEAPAPGMSEELRSIMGDAAVKAALAVDYCGAGTVEFIVDGSDGLRPDGFYFMEMNTRLQVEHPVTEAITGLDLVQWQFDVASGRPLALKQNDIAINGHAVEVRIYAEDPENGFLPSTGKLLDLHFAQEDGVRVDTGVQAGDEISPFYDPMIVKLIVHGPSRKVALSKMADVLERSVVAGPKTNAAFLSRLVSHPDFVAERFDTGFIDARLGSLISPDNLSAEIAAAAALRHFLVSQQREVLFARMGRGNEPVSAWDATDGFQLGGKRFLKQTIVLDGVEQVFDVGYDHETLLVNGVARFVDHHQPHIVETKGDLLVVLKGRQYHAALPDYAHQDDVGEGAIGAPMHGKVIAIFVETGQTVKKGDRLFIVEAMKMEHNVVAPFDGVIGSVSAHVGDQVEQGFAIVSLEADIDTAA